MERRRFVTRDGVRRVVKAARTADERRLLTREAELLHAARHPGVVELVATEQAEGGFPALVTTRVDGPTLADGAAIPIEEVGGVAAGVATTLADLHGLGLVHGAVSPRHVLLGAGRPVLCGFAHGAHTGQAPVAPVETPESFADPARAPDDPLLPSADVFALGALIRWLLQRADDASRPEAPRPPPARAPAALRSGRPLARAALRSGRPRARAAFQSGRSAMRLRALAARATAADPAQRPSARALAAAIRDAVPDSRLPLPQTAVPASGVLPPAMTGLSPRSKRTALPEPVTLRGRSGPVPPTLKGRSGPVPPTLKGRSGPASPALKGRSGETSSTQRARQMAPRGRGHRVVVGAVGVALAVAVVVTGLRQAAMPGARPSERGAQGPSAAGLPPTDQRPVAAGAGAACPPVAAPLAADTDGDGCPEALGYADGVLAAGTARWAVGQAGDQVAAGDWTCSGTPTLALLRPGTGEVFVFAGWAPRDGDLAAERAAQVDGGVALGVADLDGDRCPELMVYDRDGAPTGVPVVATR